MDRERSLDRLITFCDAVVAIAITLLGLPLVDLAAEFGKDGVDSVGELLTGNESRLFSFFLSFLVIAVLWMAHHRVYSRVHASTPGLVWANVLWLIPIVFLPFPTELLAVGDADDFGASALYIGTLIAASLALVLQVALLRRHPETHEDAPISLVPSMVVTGIMVLSLVLVALVPAVGMWPLALLAPVNLISGRIRKQRAQRAPASQ